MLTQERRADIRLAGVCSDCGTMVQHHDGSWRKRIPLEAYLAFLSITVDYASRRKKRSAAHMKRGLVAVSRIERETRGL
jgi:hypothetical protein